MKNPDMLTQPAFLILSKGLCFKNKRTLRSSSKALFPTVAASFSVSKVLHVAELLDANESLLIAEHSGHENTRFLKKKRTQIDKAHA